MPVLTLMFIAALAAPGDFKAHLEEIRGLERITDPLERCLAQPAIPDTDWPVGVWTALCRFRSNRDTPVPLDHIVALLDQEDAEGLHALFEDYMEVHYSDPHRRDTLHFAYTRFQTEEGLEAAQRWHDLDPESPFANAAMSRALTSAAHRARGTALASRTTPEQFEAMRELVAVATPYALTTLDMEPRIYSACIDLIRLGRVDSNVLIEIAGIASCRGADPSSLVLYEAWLLSAEPRWGGSPEDMAIIKQEAALYVDTNPLLWTILLSAVGDLIAYEAHRRPNEIPQEAFDMLSEEIKVAPELERFSVLARRYSRMSDPYRTIAFATAYLALMPRLDVGYMHYLRGFHLQQLGELEWAITDWIRAIDFGWRDPDKRETFNIGQGLLQLDRTEEALPWLERAAQSEQYRVNALGSLVYAHMFVLDDLARAEPYARSMIEEFPREVFAWAAMLEILDLDERREEFMDLYRQIQDSPYRDEEDWAKFIAELEALLEGQEPKDEDAP